jgi:ArsR family transcriptional regulator, arsenate/arsenite/antimonite-responsive transcriptional repressor
MQYQRRALQNEGDYQVCSERLKALADPFRLRIVTCLQRGAKNVSELASELETSIARVSHHLSVLRKVELVRTQNQGKFVLYSIRPDVPDDGESIGSTISVELGFCRLDLFQPKAGVERGPHLEKSRTD